MTGDEKSRFCDKCTTHVHDLTGMNHEEILALKVQNGGKLCGSFRLPKPLILGAGIASLALASCEPAPDKDPVVQGTMELLEDRDDKESKKIDKKVHLDPVMGIVCVPDPNLKNPKDPEDKQTKIPKQPDKNEPKIGTEKAPVLLREVGPEDLPNPPVKQANLPEAPPRILGKIAAPRHDFPPVPPVNNLDQP